MQTQVPLIVLAVFLFNSPPAAEAAKVPDPAQLLSQAEQNVKGPYCPPGQIRKTTPDRRPAVVAIEAQRPAATTTEVKISVDCREIEQDPGKAEFANLLSGGIFKDGSSSRRISFYRPKGVDPKSLEGIKIRHRQGGSEKDEVTIKIRPMDPALVQSELGLYTLNETQLVEGVDSDGKPKSRKVKRKNLFKCEEDRTEDVTAVSCSFTVSPATRPSDDQIAFIKRLRGVELPKTPLTAASTDYELTDSAVSEEYESRKPEERPEKWKKLPELDLEIWRDPESKACKSVMISAKVGSEEARKALKRLGKLLRKFDVEKAETQGFKSM